MNNETFIGDNITLRFETNKDLTGYDSLVILCESPDEGFIELSAEVLGDPTDGIVIRTLEDGDMDVEGQWKVQVYVVFSDTSDFTGKIDYLYVRNRLVAEV